MARSYSWLHTVDVDQDRERQAWNRLQALEGHGSLSPELTAQLRLALADAQGQDRDIGMDIAFLNRSAQLYGVPLADKTSMLTAPPLARPHCLPMDTPHDEAVRRSLYPVQR